MKFIIKVILWIFALGALGIPSYSETLMKTTSIYYEKSFIL